MAHARQVDVGAQLGVGIAQQTAHGNEVSSAQAIHDKRLETCLAGTQAHGVRQQAGHAGAQDGPVEARVERGLGRLAQAERDEVEIEQRMTLLDPRQR